MYFRKEHIIKQKTDLFTLFRGRGLLTYIIDIIDDMGSEC